MTEFKAMQMDDIKAGTLQIEFDNGWEYVDGFSQSVATGANYSTRYGRILIILKKENLKL